MSVIPFVDGQLYVHDMNLSGHSVDVMLAVDGDVKEWTPINSRWPRRVLGRKSAGLTAKGVWESGDTYPDEAFTIIGTADRPVTVCAESAVGSVAYFFGGVTANYVIGSQTGELVTFDVSVPISTVRAVRGNVLHTATAALSATGSDTGVQLGAVGSTQYLYAALHVFELTGSSPTLDVKIQSDNASNFPSATDRLTFTQATGITSQLTSVAGAITDDYFRVTATLGGTGSPTATFAVVAGIA